MESIHSQVAAAEPSAGCPQPGATTCQQPVRGEVVGEPYGPPTSSASDAAGGPFSFWDSWINAAERRGDYRLAKQLRADRARVNLAFGVLEPVFAPSTAAKVMLGMAAVAARDGIAIMPAKFIDHSGFVPVEHLGVGRLIV